MSSIQCFSFLNYSKKTWHIFRPNKFNSIHKALLANMWADVNKLHLSFLLLLQHLLCIFNYTPINQLVCIFFIDSFCITLKNYSEKTKVSTKLQGTHHCSFAVIVPLHAPACYENLKKKTVSFNDMQNCQVTEFRSTWRSSRTFKTFERRLITKENPTLLERLHFHPNIHCSLPFLFTQVGISHHFSQQIVFNQW